MDLLITLTPLAVSIVLITLTYFYSQACARRDRLKYLKDHADRRHRLAAWEAEAEFLKVERPNSLDKIIK